MSVNISNSKRNNSTVSKNNLKPILILSHRAIELIQKRADAEGRPKANAASQTIIEALGNSTHISGDGISTVDSNQDEKIRG